MKSYYRDRAPVYDKVYGYPERQADLRVLEHRVVDYFADCNVLEIAAGTGYWTQFIAAKADSVTATDATIEALSQIKMRVGCATVETKIVDAYEVKALGQKYNAAFAGLWLSHVPKEKVIAFLQQLHSQLKPLSKVLFIDNSQQQTKRLPISYIDSAGNTYQDRKLDDGTIHRVLKNFPSKDELFSLTDNIAQHRRYRKLDCFWSFEYTLLN